MLTFSTVILNPSSLNVSFLSFSSMLLLFLFINASPLFLYQTTSFLSFMGCRWFNMNNPMTSQSSSLKRTHWNIKYLRFSLSNSYCVRIGMQVWSIIFMPLSDTAIQAHRFVRCCKSTEPYTFLAKKRFCFDFLA